MCLHANHPAEVHKILLYYSPILPIDDPEVLLTGLALLFGRHVELLSRTHSLGYAKLDI
jgi:hypothetical protein